jgi:curved DNA-binding protein CbpA
MPPIKSRYESPFHCLGIKPSASESEIRAAYRTLALQLHPDKVYEDDREDATIQFQELQRAYEVCLKRLRRIDVPTELDWVYDSDADDHINFRGQTYDEGEFASWDAGRQPVPGQDWWDNLTQDHPAPLRKWGKACKRAHRNSRRQMTDTERVILNLEFVAAQEEYEAWRRQQEFEEQWKQKETQLNERERRYAEFFQAQRRQEGERVDWNDDYEEDFAAEEGCFQLWECQDEKFLTKKKPPAGTWRDSTPNKVSDRHGHIRTCITSSWIQKVVG